MNAMKKTLAFSTIIVVIAILCPHVSDTFDWFDSGEFIASAVTLGVSHNPGYPIYNILANGFQRFFPIGSITFRLNLLSLLIMIGVFSTLGTGISLLRQPGRQPVVPAIVWTILAIPATPLLRHQAVTNEIYPLDLLFLALTIFVSLHVRRAPSLRTACLLVFIAALAVINHYSALLWLPGPLLLLPKKVLPIVRKHLSLIIMLCVLAGSLMIYLPIRAQANPVLNWNQPDRVDRFVNHVTAHDHRSASMAYIDSDARLDRLLTFSRLISSQYSTIAWIIALILIAIAAFTGSHVFITALVIAFGHLIYTLYLNVVPFVATPFGLPFLTAMIFAASFALDQFAGKFRKTAVFTACTALVLVPAAARSPVAPKVMSGTLARAVLDACELDSILVPYTDTITFTTLALQISEHYRTDVLIIPDQFPETRPIGYSGRIERHVLEPCLKRAPIAGHPDFFRCLSRADGISRSVHVELRPETALAPGNLFAVCGPLWVFAPGKTDPLPAADIDRFIDIYSCGFTGEPARDIAATMLNTLGLQLQNNQRIRDAERVFLKTLTVDPSCTEAMINMGILAYRTGRLPEAKSWMENALKSDPRSIAALKNLGVIALQTGDRAAAVLWLRKAAGLSPDDESIRQLLREGT